PTDGVPVILSEAVGELLQGAVQVPRAVLTQVNPGREQRHDAGLDRLVLHGHVVVRLRLFRHDSTLISSGPSRGREGVKPEQGGVPCPGMKDRSAPGDGLGSGLPPAALVGPAPWTASRRSGDGPGPDLAASGRPGCRAGLRSHAGRCPGCRAGPRTHSNRCCSGRSAPRASRCGTGSLPAGLRCGFPRWDSYGDGRYSGHKINTLTPNAGEGWAALGVRRTLRTGCV